MPARAPNKNDDLREREDLLQEVHGPKGDSNPTPAEAEEDPTDEEVEEKVGVDWRKRLGGKQVEVVVVEGKG